MILLDTNVVSELMRDQRNPTVDDWLNGLPEDGIFISAITEAELRLGAALLPAGRRQRTLAAQIEVMLSQDFPGRILPFDSAAARLFAVIVSERRRAGRPISQSDAQIAAVARAGSMRLATRNLADFQGCGVPTIDPWSAA